MAKYRFIGERIFRTSVVLDVDLDELRKEERFADYDDTDILLEVAHERGGVFDTHKSEWSMEEENIRTIYEQDKNGKDGDTIFED